MKWTVAAVFFVCAAQSLAVEFKHKNECTNVHGVTSTKDMIKLTGRWYTFVHSFKSEYGCAISNRSFVKNETGLIQTVAYRIRRLNGSVLNDIYQSVVLEDTDGIFKMVFNDGDGQVLYAVLDTDYSSFAVEYMCIQKSNLVKEQVWMGTTSRTLSDAVRKKLENVIRVNGLKLETAEMPESCEGLE